MEPYTFDDIPRKLEYLSYKPESLYAFGNVNLLKRRCITIVGTRKITEYGREVIDTVIDRRLGKLGVVVVSGLAFGIDAEAHSVALDRNIPTVAVVAGGLDSGYPRRNQYLYDRIVQEGCVLSEFPVGTPVVKGMFPMRNRIMAALSDITIVIEAPKGSGALITAKYALDIGKEVVVVPGNIFHDNSSGVHGLIKEGAGILTSFEDLLAYLDLDAKLGLLELEKYDKSVIDFLMSNKMEEPFSLMQFIEAIGQQNRGLNYASILTKLEIEGILGRTIEGKYYIKVEL